LIRKRTTVADLEQRIIETNAQIERVLHDLLTVNQYLLLSIQSLRATLKKRLPDWSDPDQNQTPTKKPN